MKNETQTILLIEDDEDDIFFMQRALKKANIENPLQITRDGQEAIDYLSGQGKFFNRTEYPMPAFVFIDLKLPYMSGFEILEWIRSRRQPEILRAFILSSSNEPGDVKRARELADSYLIKPPTADQLLSLDKTFSFCWIISSVKNHPASSGFKQSVG